MSESRIAEMADALPDAIDLADETAVRLALCDARFSAREVNAAIGDVIARARQHRAALAGLRALFDRAADNNRGLSDDRFRQLSRAA